MKDRDLAAEIAALADKGKMIPAPRRRTYGPEVSADIAAKPAAKDAEIERLKGENARFQSAHDGLLAEIDKLAKHDMAVSAALRETRECLRWVICAHHVECSESKAVLARHAALAGEADHA